MFNLEALNTPEGLEAASSYLQSACYSSKNPSLLLKTAATYLLTLDSCVFPLLLCSDAALNEQFVESLSVTFPANAKDFVASTARNLLEQLKAFYLSVPPEEDDSDMAKIHFTLHKTDSILVNLSEFNYTDSSGPLSPTSPIADDENPALVKKHRKKKSRGMSIVVDDGPFKSVGIRKPSGTEEATLLESNLLEERKDFLKTYIRTLLQPTFKKHAGRRLTVKLSPTAQSSVPHQALPGNDESLGVTTRRPFVQTVESGGDGASGPVHVIQNLEEEVKDFGSWKILLSGESMRHLRQIRRSDRHMFDIVKKKIQELSIGFFSRSNQKRLIGGDNEVPIYEAKMTGDTRLVYTIDCIPDDNGERITQAIKMFGVYTHAQINSRLWAAVAHWSSKRGSEYRKRCVAREESKQSKGYAFPMSWPPMQESYETLDIGIAADADLSLELHALLTHEKFIPLTQSVLDSIIADEESTHPFCVSHREHEIIYHPSSCFVVGRSGTGKTTTMLFKMLGIERTSQKLGGNKVRQIFVTQSRVLAERVEEYFNNLIQSCASGSQTTEELEWRAAKRRELEKNLMELDEEDDSSSNLPDRLSELEDKHFPLFLTFDKLCKLLEAEFTATMSHEQEQLVMRKTGKRYRFADVPDVDMGLENVPKHQAAKPENIPNSDRRILYEDFRAKYWPHFPQSSIKGLDPALVWNEFLGVIRGSELSLESPNGSLDRVTYEGLSFRTQATFARHRSRLYDVFDIYGKLKRERQEIDSADRTHALLRHLNVTKAPIAFDYIYVDEVQDNLLIDARLLRLLCRNPHGLFWAGDTAQQITSTAFRFSDLKAFLHRVEVLDPAVQAQKRTAVQPKAFTLSINYRSHGGIIDCAHSVVQLLTELWPDSIDTLDREQGLVDGPKPNFFSGWDTESAHYEQFLFGEANHRIEFGAQQCILVRNDPAREKLRQQIGDVGVIMTLYESKGLEFSDVLLYNFFEDSPVKGEWRVVLNGISTEKRLGVAIPAFDELRHVGVCSELKFLYVGLTRARNNLWIWDASPWAEPMKQFWESRGQIEVKRPGDHVPRLAVASTAVEWEKMGRILFARGNYQQAIVCFDRAELPLLREISRCYHLRKLARVLEVGTTQRKVAFSDAGDLFSKCAVGDHDQSRKCHTRAAECYAEAGRYREASDAFCKAKEFTKGAQHARKAADFDRAAEIVLSHPVDKEVGAVISGVCRIYFLRQKAFKKARLFSDSDETFLDHFDTLGFDKSPVLIDLGRYEEAADIQLHNGNSIEAIRLYLRVASESAALKAYKTLLQAWWCTLPCVAIRDNSSPVIEELHRLSDTAQSEVSGLKEEFKIFQNIVNNDVPLLLDSSLRLLEDHKVLPGLRGLFHGLREPCDIKNFDMGQMHFHLKRLQTFGDYLRSILRMVKYDFACSLNTQKLLGYKILDGSSQEAIILPSSPINLRLSMGIGRGRDPVIRITGKGENVISIENAGQIGREIMMEEFQKIIAAHCSAAEKARCFQPICIPNIKKKCQLSDCKYLHAPFEGMKEVVNQRFGLLLHQVLVINNLDFIPRNTRLQMRRVWISKFLDVLYPRLDASGKLGDIHTPVSPHQQRELYQGLSVLREWISEAFYALNPSYTMQAVELFLIANAIDHYGVPRYFSQAYFSISKRQMSDGYRLNKEGEKQSLITDLYNGLFAHSTGAMESAVGYLSHMIVAKARADVHLLMCLLEATTARLLAGLKPHLHGLIIPTSWLFTLAQHQDWPSVHIFAYLSHLLKPLISLVKDIQNGCEHLNIGGKHIRGVHPNERTMAIKRIFRCLVLAGCNYESDVVRNTMIGANIASVRVEGETNLILPTNYVNAETWDALVQAATQSPLSDPIIQLVNVGIPESINIIPNIQRHHFQSIPSLLSASPLVLPAVPKFKLRPEAKPFVPQIKLAIKKDDESASQNAIPHAQTSKASRLPTTLLDESKLDDVFTPEAQMAARKILSFYRRFHPRLLSQFKPNPLRRWYSECCTASQSSGFSRPYRTTFIGPLPHLLLCMDGFRMHLEEQKNHASLSRIVNHSEIEAAMVRMQQIIVAKGHFLQTFEDLKPSSAFHRLQNIEKLRKKVSEICKHIEGYCQESPELAEHFAIAYRGIVQERPDKKMVVTQPKPSLNTSDLFEY